MMKAIPIELKEKSEDKEFYTTLYHCPDCNAIIMPRDAVEKCYCCGVELQFCESIDYNKDNSK